MNARTADAVVIGAGIAGCATAYYLSKKGLNVVVVDKGEVGDEQSSRAWGFVRQQARTARELPLMIAGAIIWQEMERELGADVEWNQGGSLTLAGDEEILGRIRAWLKVGEQFGIETKFLTNEDVEELLPAMRGEWLGAMYTPSDGHAQPNKATNAIAIGAREHGALFRTMEAVEGIEVTDGQVSAVITERDRIVTRNVVCAAGAWSHKVSSMVGLTLPYRMVRASVGQTNPTDHVTDMAVIGAPDRLPAEANGRSLHRTGARGHGLRHRPGQLQPHPSFHAKLSEKPGNVPAPRRERADKGHPEKLARLPIPPTPLRPHRRRRARA